MSTEGQFRIVLCRSVRKQLTLDELALHAGLHPDFVQRFIEFGLINASDQEGTNLLFDPSTVSRLRTIVRLREALGVNLAGISVILDLLDKLCALQQENRTLQSRL
jgi:MerR family transcriptional regulator/heat shock protein HspR